jgi:hypothetical protein
MARFFRHLIEGESDYLEPEGSEPKSPASVLFEGRPTAVEFISVCFDHERTIPPKEIHLEAANLDVDLRIREPVALTKP